MCSKFQGFNYSNSDVYLLCFYTRKYHFFYVFYISEFIFTGLKVKLSGKKKNCKPFSSNCAIQFSVLRRRTCVLFFILAKKKKRKQYNRFTNRFNFCARFTDGRKKKLKTVCFITICFHVSAMIVSPPLLLFCSPTRDPFVYNDLEI